MSLEYSEEFYEDWKPLPPETVDVIAYYGYISTSKLVGVDETMLPTNGGNDEAPYYVVKIAVNHIGSQLLRSIHYLNTRKIEIKDDHIEIYIPQ